MTIFEKIIKGEIRCSKVLENDGFLAFHDINPQAPVHILIVPKTNYKSFDEMPSSLLCDMGDFIKQVTSTTGLNKTGYRLITNVGQDAGQEVFHMHFHLLGGAKLSWGKCVEAQPEVAF